MKITKGNRKSIKNSEEFDIDKEIQDYKESKKLKKEEEKDSMYEFYK